MTTLTDTRIRPTARLTSSRRRLASVLALFLAATVATNVVTIGAVLGASALGWSLGDPLTLVALTIPPQAAMFLAGYWYVTRRLGGLSVSLPSLEGVALVALGTAAMLAVNAVSGAIVAALGVVTPANPVLAAITGDPLVFALYALVILAAVAPAEELLYRGAIQGGLRSAFGAGWAIVGAAGLFGLMHLGQYVVLGTPVTTAVVVSLVVIAFNGVIIGLLYERTGTLLVPIAAHGLFNVALLVIGALGA